MAPTKRPKFIVGDPVMPNGKASADYRGRRGIVTEISTDGSECRVEFDDGAQPTTGYLKALWLEH